MIRWKWQNLFRSLWVSIPSTWGDPSIFFFSKLVRFYWWKQALTLRDLDNSFTPIFCKTWNPAASPFRRYGRGERPRGVRSLWITDTIRGVPHTAYAKDPNWTRIESLLYPKLRGFDFLRGSSIMNQTLDLWPKIDERSVPEVREVQRSVIDRGHLNYCHLTLIISNFANRRENRHSSCSRRAP